MVSDDWRRLGRTLLVWVMVTFVAFAYLVIATGTLAGLAHVLADPDLWAQEPWRETAYFWLRWMTPPIGLTAVGFWLLMVGRFLNKPRAKAWGWRLLGGYLALMLFPIVMAILSGT